jgi:hypothetical protein
MTGAAFTLWLLGLVGFITCMLYALHIQYIIQMTSIAMHCHV